MSNVRAFVSKRVVDGYRMIHDGVVVIADGKIQAVGAQKTTRKMCIRDSRYPALPGGRYPLSAPDQAPSAGRRGCNGGRH